jgi:3-isopropylmalate dehydratase small subunit
VGQATQRNDQAQSCLKEHTNGKSYSFDVDSFRKDCLYRGLDDIGLTLENEKSITSFEKQRRSKFRKCLKENKGK